MLSAAFITALPFSGVIANTGMIIWALIGIAGMLSGLMTVRAARRRSRLDAPTGTAAPAGAALHAAQVTGHTNLVPQDDLTQAA